ncbi:hypothetical protein BFP70_09905 [Thioclava sp. SK-1]|uniref:hypothetical protein n=1 Tax=Thioclava sp. SK-1 TaxID=1889770 RepID=UPI0008270708|nr:hypothetical protein [Thioclava sp. SK-1]OCX65368.1 hypothetical protein BFP70_09905 [Thioclava sp. SK-1]
MTPKRRMKAALPEHRAKAVGSNDIWAVDLVHGHLALRQKLRMLTVVDTRSFCPALHARFSYRGEKAVWTLEKVGCPIG